MDYSGCCFASDAEIKVIDMHGPNRIVQIKDIKKGMFVSSEKGLAKVLCLVVSPPAEMVYVINPRNGFGFWVTKQYPLRARDKWKPAEKFASKAPIECGICYNLVLDSGHVIYVNGYEAVTLGHGKTGSVVEHEYLGTSRIIEDLSQEPGWEMGLVKLGGFLRNDQGTVCGILPDNSPMPETPKR